MTDEEKMRVLDSVTILKDGHRRVPLSRVLDVVPEEWWDQLEVVAGFVRRDEVDKYATMAGLQSLEVEGW